MQAEHEHDDVVDNAPAGAAPDRLAHIRARRQMIANRKTLTLHVPGYDGVVAVRYKSIPKEDVDGYVERIRKATEKGKLMAANADLLIRCCADILVRQDEAGKWEPIDGAGEPTTFQTGTLAALLGETAETARDEVYALFSPDGSQPMAHGAHAGALSEWMAGQATKIDEELLAEGN